MKYLGICFHLCSFWSYILFVVVVVELQFCNLCLHSSDLYFHRILLVWFFWFLIAFPPKESHIVFFEEFLWQITVHLLKMINIQFLTKWVIQKQQFFLLKSNSSFSTISIISVCLLLCQDNFLFPECFYHNNNVYHVY